MLWKQIACYLVSQVCCCCCSAAQSCPALCNPMECSMPGFPVLHYLMEFAETHVRWVDDAIQPSQVCHSLLLLPQTFPASGSSPVSWLFASDGQSIGASSLASVLPMIVQHRFPQDWLVWSPCSIKTSQVSSPAAPHFDVWSFVLKMYMAVLSASSSRRVLRAVQLIILSLAQIKFHFFNLIGNCIIVNIFLA